MGASIVELRLAADVDAWRAIGLVITDGVAVVGGVRLCFEVVEFVSEPASGSAPASGLMAITVAGAPDPKVAAVDGLTVLHVEPTAPSQPSQPTEPTARSQPTEPGDGDTLVGHPFVGIDHVVVMTDSLERTCAAIEDRLGAPLKRVREAGGGVRQGFHRLGEVIVEVVEVVEVVEAVEVVEVVEIVEVVEVVEVVETPGEVVETPGEAGPPQFWGLVLIVANADALHALATRLGPDLISTPKPAVQSGRYIASFRHSAALGLPVALMTP